MLNRTKISRKKEKLEKHTLDMLMNIAQLHYNGILTDEEFQKKKTEFLKQIGKIKKIEPPKPQGNRLFLIIPTISCLIVSVSCVILCHFKAWRWHRISGLLILLCIICIICRLCNIFSLILMKRSILPAEQTKLQEHKCKKLILSAICIYSSALLLFLLCFAFNDGVLGLLFVLLDCSSFIVLFALCFKIKSLDTKTKSTADIRKIRTK